MNIIIILYAYFSPCLIFHPYLSVLTLKLLWNSQTLFYYECHILNSRAKITNCITVQIAQKVSVYKHQCLLYFNLIYQGTSFLQNLIYGKKLRISVKSECFDGTVLVKAFQGNLDIGEEVLKFKFATVTLPANRESPSPAKALQKQTGLWPSRRPQGDCDSTSSLGYMPKLRPVFSNQKPQVLK